MRLNRFVLAGFAVTVAAAAHAQDIRVVVDGERVYFRNQPPVMINDRVLVPLRGVFEELGAKVNWDPERQTVTAFREDTKVRLRIGEASASVNDEPVQLDVPAQIIDSSTMVPLRFIGEALGEHVQWNEVSQTVTISEDKGYAFDHDRDRDNRDQDRDHERSRQWRRNEGGAPPPPPPVEEEPPVQPPHAIVVPPPPDSPVVYEPETVLPVSLDFSFNVDRCRPGQRISTAIQPYPGLPKGCRAEGTVLDVVRYPDGPPAIEIQFDRIVTPAGRSYHIEGRSFPIDPHFVRTRDRGLLSVRDPRTPAGMLRVANGDTFGLRLSRTVRIDPEGLRPRRWRN